MFLHRQSAIRRFFILTCLLFISGITASQAAKFQEVIATPDLLEALSRGGYVIYMRHGQTDNAHPDRAPKVDLNDCDTQRILNDEGKRITREVGQYLRQAHIPIGEVFSSPMCRTKESALNAFGHYTLEPNIMYTGGMTSTQKKPVLAKTRELISTPVLANVNRVLVAHGPNMMDLIGYFPQEATLVIFKPQGNSHFEYLGSIRPQDWPDLLAFLPSHE